MTEKQPPSNRRESRASPVLSAESSRLWLCGLPELALELLSWRLMWMGEGVTAQVSFSSLDHGTKCRGPSPKALVPLSRATLIFTHLNHDRFNVHQPLYTVGLQWPWARTHDTSARSP
ncbi:hypothetical protein TNCV_4858601 [Trichonephila clavipes]|nr:hypothetical protein TNCV_4858601 [Trichonephila clavipes]